MIHLVEVFRLMRIGVLIFPRKTVEAVGKKGPLQGHSYRYFIFKWFSVC